MMSFETVMSLWNTARGGALNVRSVCNWFRNKKGMTKPAVQHGAMVHGSSAPVTDRLIAILLVAFQRRFCRFDAIDHRPDPS
jgi:hypothetical protein